MRNYRGFVNTIVNYSIKFGILQSNVALIKQPKTNNINELNKSYIILLIKLKI